MKAARPHLAAAVFLLLASCATAGTKVDPKVVATFKPGETSYTEVVAKLGTPSREMTMSNGSKMVTYTYARSVVRPETFIPFVGAFVGGNDTTSSAYVFQFTPDGKLTNSSSSSGQLPVSTGLAAGG